MIKITNISKINSDPKRPWRVISMYEGQDGWLMNAAKKWDRQSRAQKYCDIWNELVKNNPPGLRAEYKTYKY